MANSWIKYFRNKELAIRLLFEPGAYAGVGACNYATFLSRRFDLFLDRIPLE